MGSGASATCNQENDQQFNQQNDLDNASNFIKILDRKLRKTISEPIFKNICDQLFSGIRVNDNYNKPLAVTNLYDLIVLVDHMIPSFGYSECLKQNNNKENRHNMQRGGGQIQTDKCVCVDGVLSVCPYMQVGNELLNKLASLGDIIVKHITKEISAHEYYSHFLDLNYDATVYKLEGVNCLEYVEYLAYDKNTGKNIKNKNFNQLRFNIVPICKQIMFTSEQVEIIKSVYDLKMQAINHDLLFLELHADQTGITQQHIENPVISVIKKNQDLATKCKNIHKKYDKSIIDTFYSHSLYNQTLNGVKTVKGNVEFAYEVIEKILSVNFGANFVDPLVGTTLYTKL